MSELKTKHKIVMLDSWTSNSGDLSWESFEKLGTFVHYPRTKEEQVLERCRGADIVLTNKVVLSSETMAQLPELKYIGVMATGYNVVDLDAAHRHGVVVTNVPAYSTNSVAQMVFALLLHHAQHVALYDQKVHAGDWSACEDFSFRDAPLLELTGKAMGIVGFGNIGRKVAAIGKQFGLRILVYTRNPGAYLELNHVDGVYEATDFESLLRRSDIVTLHCPLNSETQELINSRSITFMRQDAVLINTGRGALLDEDAVASALVQKRLGALLTDVLSTEPPSPDNPLLQAPNCVITPHIGWATRAARQRLLDTVSDNIRAYQAGQSQNVVI
ncbi:MAG: D-2-hydroxyacid dehydrogenase [Thermodesulfobacteriota bacterium]